MSFPRAARFVERLRGWLRPLALCALLAVGAHAAADALGDVFLEGIDRAMGAFDALVSKWSLTAPLIDWIGFARRTQLARGLALIFELLGDALLAWPMLRFTESTHPVNQARELFLRALRRPTLFTWTRTIFSLLVALAGAASVARLLHGAIALELRPLFGRSGLGLPWLFGLFFLLWLVATLSSRATLWMLARGEERSPLAVTPRQRWLVGAIGSALLLPLALVALFRATPLASFFRG